MGVVSNVLFSIAMWVGQRTLGPPRPSFLRDVPHKPVGDATPVGYATPVGRGHTPVGDMTLSEFCVATSEF